ncbi:hypothetical protein CLU79DRAFT_116818 [Phycomyces nitens]|nr:hypothetical protein CLU79DRAFT_116818 [Phycomyces nitens]
MSHRKSSRGKKSSDANINFVFKMGDQGPSSAPSPGSVTSPNLFGVGTTPSTPSLPFSYNTQSSIANSFGSSNVTPTASPHQSPAISPVRRTEGFVFGSPNTSGVAGLSNTATPTSPFGFGAQFGHSSSNISVASTASSFRRGISDIPGLPETESNMFGSDSSSRGAPAPFEFSQPQGYGHGDNSSSRFSISSPLTVFGGFGQQQQQQQQHQQHQLQQSSGPDDMETTGSGTSPPTQSGFSFGMPTTAGSGFGHGNVATPPPTAASGFSFGQTPASNNQSTFSFGSPVTGPIASNAAFSTPATGGFSFKKPSDNVSASSLVASPFGTPTAQGGFTFGAQNNNNMPAPNFSFGSKSNSPNTEPSSSTGAFTLNQSNTTPTVSMSETPSEKPSVPSGGFTFGNMVAPSKEQNPPPQASSATNTPSIIGAQSSIFGSAVAGPSNSAPSLTASEKSAKDTPLSTAPKAAPIFNFDNLAKKPYNNTPSSAESTSETSALEPKKELVFNFGAKPKKSNDDTLSTESETTTERSIKIGKIEPETNDGNKGQELKEAVKTQRILRLPKSLPTNLPTRKKGHHLQSLLEPNL